MTKKQIQEWHEEGVQLANTYLKCETRMVELLSFLASASGYLYFQCPSTLTDKFLAGLTETSSPVGI